MVRYSIIIPVKAINDYIMETVPCIQALDSNEWELIILPNEQERDRWGDTRIRVIPSGRVGPGKKRDLGATYATGEILVFLDDDSYPNPDLLKVADPFFRSAKVVAIGGPAITPPSDSFWQKVSGAVFLSKYSGGNPERYISIGKEKEIDDWPSVNFMVRKGAFEKIGGFNSKYWPGEDTKLCSDLLAHTGAKIMYAPDLIVWHHRRPGIRQHLKQVGAYGRHRGFFARVLPSNSRKLKYFFPSALVCLAFSTMLSIAIDSTFLWCLIFLWCCYLIVLVVAWTDIAKYESKKIAYCAILYIILSHIAYGINFMIGFFTKELNSKLR